MTLFFVVILKKKDDNVDDWYLCGYTLQIAHPLRRGLLVRPKLRASTLHLIKLDHLGRDSKSREPRLSSNLGATF